jgi:cell division protein ZapA
MDSDNTGKAQVRLSIYNQTFSLLVAGDPAEIEQAAHEVDELMTTIARSGNMDSTRVAVLACLHLQDRVHTLEREFAEMKSRVDDKTRRLSTLLDGVIEGADASD